VLWSGDALGVAPDRRHVSFMVSCPSFLPLSASTVDSIMHKVMPLRFDCIYGHFFGLEIGADAKTLCNGRRNDTGRPLGISK
jgi:hypothetical protein